MASRQQQKQSKPSDEKQPVTSPDANSEVEKTSNAPTPTPDTTPEQTTPEDGSPSGDAQDGENTPESAQDGAGVSQDQDGASDAAAGQGEADPAMFGPRRSNGAEPEGRIIRLGEPVTIDATPHETFAVVNVAHYQERRLRGSKRVTYALLYAAGATIPLTALEVTEG